MLKYFVVRIVVIASLMVFPSAIWAVQKNQDQVRGSFLSTRPGGTAAKPKPKKAVPKKKTSDVTSSGSTEPTASSHNLAISTPGTAVGLGYTLFMKGPKDQPVRVDTNREFVTGDAIRILLEPNIDGFLYIFHTEQDKNPQLLFPDPRLQAGSNAVRAHVPYEVPSSTDANQRNQWFVFDGAPTTERLLIIIARQPITGIPIGQELVQKYAGNENGFQWSPSKELWAKIRNEKTGAQIVSTNSNAGTVQTKLEQTSLTRSLGLPKGAPAPSVILMNQSANKENLVTEVDLTHK
ncbi:MAG: DUF4384 domain-containing protein [Acidobacteria bacterium]|nr:DUF4384 domain-containing protein [Acidobacteriota bacterium]